MISNQEQNLQVLLGSPGTGKSFVIKTLTEIFGKECKLSASTGCAAANIGLGATTLHNLCMILVNLTANTLKKTVPELPKTTSREVQRSPTSNNRRIQHDW
jgi:DNA repair ATPase RecN